MTVTPRRICVFTGSRAEYGLLRWTLVELDKHPAVELQILVSGTHLSPGHGMTVRAIREDGFTPAAEVEMLVSSKSAVGVAKSVGLGLIGFADTLERLQPDLVVVLGDRYEALAMASTVMLARVPLAHIAGGESTEGAVDESIRHAITKMAHLHFVATDEFRERVVQLGEAPTRVFTVGAPGLDGIEKIEPLSVQQLEVSLGVRLAHPLLLVTYHPVTGKRSDPTSGIGSLLRALDSFPHATVVVTQPNADTAASLISEAIESYATQHRERVHVFTSLGQRRYLNLLRAADVAIGNSSSGLIEAPAVRTATVNVGDRQRGRPSASSVLHCSEDVQAIIDGIREALSPKFQRGVCQAVSPYGQPGAARRISNVLATIDLPSLLDKPFYRLAPNGISQSNARRQTATTTERTPDRSEEVGSS